MRSSFTLDNLNLLIDALIFKIDEEILCQKAFIKRHYSKLGDDIVYSKLWRLIYRRDKVKAICILIMAHYGSVIVTDGSELICTNNPNYLYDWLYGRDYTPKIWC